tara:strand:- start:21015 stop:22193 length:1179 start_codon:yes stop_codon:yes gene_type:complete
MQLYSEIPESTDLSDSLAPLLNNDKTMMSNHSGPTVPALNLQLGMFWHDTTAEALKQLIFHDDITPANNIWKTILDLTKTSTNAEYVDTQVLTRQAPVTGAPSSILYTNLTASRVAISGADGKIAASTITTIELDRLDGVTSNVQTQLNGKLATGGKAVDSSLADYATDAGTVATFAVGAAANQIPRNTTIRQVGLNADLLDGQHAAAFAAAAHVHNEKITFTKYIASGTWTCPANVTQVIAVVAGGGGGGGTGWDDGYILTKGGTGGRGRGEVGTYAVTPGANYTITVASGGAGGPATAGTTKSTGSAGGTSSFSTHLSAIGGSGGTFAAAGSNGTIGASSYDEAANTPFMTSGRGGEGGFASSVDPESTRTLRAGQNGHQGHVTLIYTLG